MPGHIYFVTAVCAQRRRIFADFDVACAASRVLAEPRLWRDGELLAWVLMPDHWHGLLRLGESIPLSTVMQRAKANSSREVANAFALPTPMWQPGFHDRALRSEAHLRETARYLVANPLRAGLARSLADYPFWDCVWGIDAICG